MCESRNATMRVFRQVPEQPYQLSTIQTRRHLVGLWSILDALYQIRPHSLDPAHFQRKQRYFRMGFFNMTVMCARDLHAHHAHMRSFQPPNPTFLTPTPTTTHNNHHHTHTPQMAPTFYDQHLTFPLTHAREQCRHMRHSIYVARGILTYCIS